MSTALVTASKTTVLPQEEDRELYFQEHGGKLHKWLATNITTMSRDVWGVVAAYLVGPRSILESEKTLFTCTPSFSGPNRCYITPSKVDVAFEKFYNSWFPTNCWTCTLPALRPETVDIVYRNGAGYQGTFSVGAFKELEPHQFPVSLPDEIRTSRSNKAVFVCMQKQLLRKKREESVIITAVDQIYRLKKTGAPYKFQPKALDFVVCVCHHKATTGETITGMSLIEERVQLGNYPICIGKEEPGATFTYDFKSPMSADNLDVAAVMEFPTEPL